MEVFCVYIVHFYSHIAKITENYFTSFYVPHTLSQVSRYISTFLSNIFVRHLFYSQLCNVVLLATSRVVPKNTPPQFTALRRGYEKHTTNLSLVLNHENP